MGSLLSPSPSLSFGISEKPGLLLFAAGDGRSVADAANVAAIDSHRGVSKQISISLSLSFRRLRSSQLLTSSPSARSGSATTRTVLTTPYSASAAVRAFLRPGSSLSCRMITSRPAKAWMQSSVHLPAATVVAQWPSAAMRSASFSPSVTKTVASGYFSSSGQRYSTRFTSPSELIQPPCPSGRRWLNVFGSKRST
jgi:hypothetical protein